MIKRKLIIILIVVLTLAAGFFLLSGLRKSNTLPGFQLAEVLLGDLEIVVSSTGTLSAVETVAVGAEVSGTVKKVCVDYNDTVETEALLAVIDPTTFVASVQEAEASVMKAEAMVEKARAEYERNRKLYEKEYLSEFECLTLETSLKAAEADLLSARARLVQAQNNLENTEIRSPISGTVIERSVDAGQTIASSFQAPELFVIAEDLRTMQIEADVDENDIGQIEEDQYIRFTVQAYPDLAFEGEVRQVRLQPETIQNVVNYTVVIDVSNDKGLLLPGMTATIDFIILDHPDTLLVPNSALSFQPPAPDESTGGGLFSNLLKNAPGEKMPGRPMIVEPPAGKARVFCLTEEGYPDVAFFTPGESDGIYTEVLESVELREGMQIVTGVLSPDKKKQTVSRNSLLPTPGRPPGGRQM